jgi:hypothetical protein
MNEVVEDGLHPRVLEVVAPIVDDEERVEARLPEAGGEVQVPRLSAAERVAVEAERLERPLARERVLVRPGRELVPISRTGRGRGSG